MTLRPYSSRPRLTAAGLVLTLAALAPAAPVGEPKAGQAPAWNAFKSDAGRFSVELPGTPKLQKQTINNIHNYAYSLSRPEGTFVVSYFDLPPGLQITPDRAVTAYAGGRKGTIVSQKNVTLDDEYPGIDAQVRLPSGQVSRICVYAVRGRQYQLVLDGGADFVRSADANRFFGSFRVQ